MDWKRVSTVFLAGWLGLAQGADFAIGERLKPEAAAADAKEIDWKALVPPDWDPQSRFKALKLDKLSDSDPRAMEALAQLRAELDHAPVVQKLAGTRLKIPGFVVNLDANMAGVKEFLLVPYFGACIHVPPPPANQIIHVFPDNPVPQKVAMFPVWVSGTLETTRSNTNLGAAGYRIRNAAVEPYPWQEKRKRQ
ncbi:MAG: DUF3299 domain-containing protein [Candidatus Methylophosphatis roskildensis]